MTTIAKVTKPSLDFYFWMLKVLLTSLMLLMIVPVLLQILSRYSGIIPRYITQHLSIKTCRELDGGGTISQQTVLDSLLEFLMEL